MLPWIPNRHQSVWLYLFSVRYSRGRLSALCRNSAKPDRGLSFPAGTWHPFLQQGCSRTLLDLHMTYGVCGHTFVPQEKLQSRCMHLCTQKLKQRCRNAFCDTGGVRICCPCLVLQLWSACCRELQRAAESRACTPAWLY